MNCPRCGYRQADFAGSFCSQCGSSLPVQPPTYADQPTIVAAGFQPVDPAYYGPRPGPVPPTSPTRGQRDWLRHPGTWAMTAAVLVVAGVVAAALIVSGGSGGAGSRTRAQAAPSTSAAAVATSAAPGTQTQTVVVVPTAPGGAPVETRTVTVPVGPPSEPAAEDGPFANSTAVSADYYRRGDTVYFDSPSHNIGCRLVADGTQAQCTIADYDFSEPGRDCPRGAGVLMDVGSTAVIDCIHNPAYNGETTLEFGETVSFGSFSCVSRSSGVTCVDAYGSGFTLSREAYIVR